MAITICSSTWCPSSSQGRGRCRAPASPRREPRAGFRLRVIPKPVSLHQKATGRYLARSKPASRGKAVPRSEPGPGLGLSPRGSLCRAMVLTLLLASAAPARAVEGPCAAPVVLDDGWQTAEPEASGFDAAALCAALERVAGDASNIHGVVVERRGRLVAELYRRGKD